MNLLSVKRKPLAGGPSLGKEKSLMPALVATYLQPYELTGVATSRTYSLPNTQVRTSGADKCSAGCAAVGLQSVLLSPNMGLRSSSAKCRIETDRHSRLFDNQRLRHLLPWICWPILLRLDVKCKHQHLFSLYHTFSGCWSLFRQKLTLKRSMCTMTHYMCSNS